MWTKFWFESNAIWGEIDSPLKWARVKRIYDAAYGSGIYDCKKAPSEYQQSPRMPNFGQRREHQGDETLGEFFDRHGMPRM